MATIYVFLAGIMETRGLKKLKQVPGKSPKKRGSMLFYGLGSLGSFMMAQGQRKPNSHSNEKWKVGILTSVEVARKRFELLSRAPEAPMLDHYTTGLQP